MQDHLDRLRDQVARRARAPRAFLEGVASVYSIDAGPGLETLGQVRPRSPAEDIRRAWRDVGDSLRQAMRSLGAD